MNLLIKVITAPLWLPIKVVGLLLIILTVYLGFQAEFNQLMSDHLFQFMYENAKYVPANQQDLENNGALIHIFGEAKAPEDAKDSQIKVAANALRLKRVVEVYQWHLGLATGSRMPEEERYLGFKMQWSDLATQSPLAPFIFVGKYQNPTKNEFKPAIFSAHDIHVGDFVLSEDMLEAMDFFQEYPLTQSHYDKLEPSLKQRFTLFAGKLYSGDPHQPSFGSVRISYQIVKPQMVTVVGQQKGALVQTYALGKDPIRLIEDGAYPSLMNLYAAQIVKGVDFEDRALWFFLAWLGFSLLICRWTIVIPIAGIFLNFGLTLLSSLFSLAILLAVNGVCEVSYDAKIGLIKMAIAGALFLLLLYIKINLQPQAKANVIRRKKSKSHPLPKTSVEEFDDQDDGELMQLVDKDDTTEKN